MKQILTIIAVLLCLQSSGQGVVYAGNTTQLLKQRGGFVPVRYFHPPMSFSAMSDSLGMVWIDSTTTKKLMWHTGVYRRYVASERYVDSLFATAVTGVTQQTLDDTAAAIRADITGGSTDSSVYSTKAYRQKGIDSVNGTVAARVKYTDTAAMLLPYQRTVNATSGTVTSVATGYGVSGGTITTSGTISADTAAMATRSRVQKAVDSLNISIGTKGSGTVTSVATNNGTGITGGAITGTGTIAADTTILGTRAWRDKAVDSLNVLIAAKGVGTVTSVGTGYGVTGGTITGSGTVVVDTATLFTKYTTTLGAGSGISITGRTITATSGSGTVTDVIGGTNISITGTSTIQPTVNITGTIAVANGGTGVTTQTSVNTTPITYGVDNTVTASALTLTTTTLNPTVVTSSLTSVGTITAGTWSSTIGSAATGSTQAINNNSTQIATTAYVDRYFPVDTTISAAYTLTSRDFHRTIHCTNGSNIALTIPTGLGTTFECVVLAEGAGTVTPTTSSTTFYYQPTSTTKIKSQGGATIRSWATANSYLIIGSLE